MEVERNSVDFLLTVKLKQRGAPYNDDAELLVLFRQHGY